MQRAHSVRRPSFLLAGVLLGGLALLAAIVLPATADEHGEELSEDPGTETPTCKDHGGFSTNREGDTSGDWGSIEFSPDSGPLELTVNEGWEVLLCIKKGSGIGGDPWGGPVTVGPFGEGDHTIQYPDGDGGQQADGFSHYDFIATELNGEDPGEDPGEEPGEEPAEEEEGNGGGGTSESEEEEDATVQAQVAAAEEAQVLGETLAFTGVGSTTLFTLLLMGLTALGAGASLIRRATAR